MRGKIPGVKYDDEIVPPHSSSCVVTPSRLTFLLHSAGVTSLDTSHTVPISHASFDIGGHRHLLVAKLSRHRGLGNWPASRMKSHLLSMPHLFCLVFFEVASGLSNIEVKI
jgi:hypothetical protein